ncbi:MAG: SpoIIIAH-like family protein [Clostridia bacterium]|nr:SpoIIIAH-like family protein [Clostridia bacterium]
MKPSEFMKKIQSVGNRFGKKTLIAACAVVVLGCAVVLNFILQSNAAQETSTGNLALDLSKDSDPTITALNPDEIKDYFATITLQRQQARDEAMEVLKTVAESTTALDDAKEAALVDINRLALEIEREANIETLILSKGFEQCVAVINDDNCNVIIKTTGLLPGDVAQISEIVYEQAGIHPNNLKIIEKTDIKT